MAPRQLSSWLFMPDFQMRGHAQNAATVSFWKPFITGSTIISAATQGDADNGNQGK